VTPLTPPTAGNSDLEAAATDLAGLASEISARGIAADDMVVIAAMPQALKLRLLSGPNFTNLILGTDALADRTVVGIAPAGVGVGYAGAPDIETSKQATFHFEDTTPLPIGSPGAPATVASPTRNAVQQDLRIVKVRARCAWAALPGAVQTMANVNW
jgi:hypothetical protein